MIMAVFWLLLYIVVNLMSILYLGALAISGISGLNIYFCLIMLALFAIVITLGGMKVIGYTDVIQVFFLIVGGLAATYIGLNLIAEKTGQTGLFNGLKILTTEANDHFHMIFSRSNANYMDLPGLSVLIGGMWIANLSYWGCNQYITQRALGANLKTARNGLLFGAFLKILMPMIVVLPGIAAFLLYSRGMFQQEMLDSKGLLDVNKAYPSLLSLLPAGLKGLSFAALTAAIVASLAGKANSISTIFILDIYKKAINKKASERRQVFLGRVTVVVAMAIAILLAFAVGERLMGEGKQGFQYIQEYTGFVSPGIFAMFFLGLFWKKTTSNAALFATIGGFAFAVILKFLPQFANLSFLAPIGFSKDDGTGVFVIPFLDRMAIIFIACLIGMWIISTIENKRGVRPNGLEIDSKMFHVNSRFAVGALIALGLLAALYIAYW
jgi:solute:Na+ symporter, SSS family